MAVSDKPRPMQMVFSDTEGNLTSSSEDADSDDTVADEDECRSQHKRFLCVGRGSDDDNEDVVEITGRFSLRLHAMNDSDETDFVAHGSNE